MATAANVCRAVHDELAVEEVLVVKPWVPGSYVHDGYCGRAMV